MESKHWESRDPDNIGYTKGRKQIRTNGEKEKDRDTENKTCYSYVYFCTYTFCILWTFTLNCLIYQCFTQKEKETHIT